MPDIAGDSSTTATVTVGGTATGDLETNGDHDWFAVTLTAGQAVTIAVNGVTLADPYLYVRDSSGALLYSNDDIVDGVNHDSRVSFNPGYSGTYYIDVGAWSEQLTGTYQVSVQPYVPPPVATVDQIADQLTTGYWMGEAHHFNVTQGGTITVDISTLNAAEQVLARAALQEWSDIIGVTFQEVSTGDAQIVFDHSEDPDGPIAETSAKWADGITSSARVHISTSWVNDYGTGLDSYSFQTYVHEIGHALGLGHAGDYNGTARYPYDASFKNDGWPITVMSYFSQSDNNYYGHPEQFVLTPMGADIIAMRSLYGLSTTTRTGDTVYGYHSNAGGIYDAGLYPNAAYAIFDSGGNDTLDFSGTQIDQRINLTAETFSDVNGHNQALYIARGVTIENAIGGSGNDTITQNAANNYLDGGAGDDTVSYETATASVTVNLGITSAQNTGGAGIDTVINFERLIGTAFADVLIGTTTTISLTGGGGDDLIEVGSAPGPNIGLYGGDGNDRFIPNASSGNEWIDGGAGYNIIDFSNASVGVLLTTEGSYGASPFMVQNIQEIIGSNYADHINAFRPGATLIGGGGDDILESQQGGTELIGGTGNDTYSVVNSSDHITEYAGEGIDTVISRGDYALGANLENLTLYEYNTLGYVQPSQEAWSGTGNDLANVIIGNIGANILNGAGGDDRITGNAGADVLTGGFGNDMFVDTVSGHNGDTITDFSIGDAIVFSNATAGSFTFSLSGNTLTYSGGTLTLGYVSPGQIVAQAAIGGGVQLTIVAHEAQNDFNGDGKSDALWRNDNGAITDWLGQSDGSLAIQGWSLNPGPGWHVAATGDFDGDGKTDVLWRSDSGEISDWLGQANGGFAANAANFDVNPGASWYIAGSADFNGDGRADLIVRDDLGNVREWLGQTNGSFTDNVANVNMNPGANWRVDGTGDFNGDGRGDILWRDDAGNVREWLGQANGALAGNIANVNLNPGLNWHVVATGDFNGDGRSDVIWRDDSGIVREWLGQANGGFVGNVANVNVNPGLNWHVIGSGDYNGDGFSDLLWRSDDGTVREWLGQPSGAFSGNIAHVDVNPGSSWHLQPQHDAFA